MPAVDGLIAATALPRGLHPMTGATSGYEPIGVMLINPWDARR